MKYEYIAEAKQIGKKYKDGSGETSVSTDGLSVSTMDHRDDNLTPIRLQVGKKYRVQLIVEEI